MSKIRTRPAPQAKTFRIRAGRYKPGRGPGANVLPHGVTVRMTTTRSGKAKWTYTEEFKFSQLPSREMFKRTRDDTLAACRSLPGNKLKVRVRGRRITITGTTSREDFADCMICEFIAWGGKFGSITFAQFMLAAMRMTFAGWQP